jgi:hypothetical protein
MTSTASPAVYRIEFGPAWPIPPITVDYSDPNEAARAVTRHALPYLRTRLEELGRPEFADCFFHTSQDRTVGQFMWLDLPAGRGAKFCPARLTPTDLDPDICGADYDDEVCDLDPGHDGDHCANASIGWANDYPRPAV